MEHCVTKSHDSTPFAKSQSHVNFFHDNSVIIHGSGLLIAFVSVELSPKLKKETICHQTTEALSSINSKKKH